MRILYVNDMKVYGGAEQVVNALVKSMQEHGHVADLFVPPTADRDSNIPLFIKRLDNFKPDLLHLHNIARIGEFVVIEAEKRGIPIIQTVHDYWLVCKQRDYYDWKKGQVCIAKNWDGCNKCENVLCALSEPPILFPIYRDKRLVTVSNFMRQVLIGFGYDPKNISVVHNGLDLSVWHP